MTTQKPEDLNHFLRKYQDILFREVITTKTPMSAIDADQLERDLPAHLEFLARKGSQESHSMADEYEWREIAVFLGESREVLEASRRRENQDKIRLCAGILGPTETADPIGAEEPIGTYAISTLWVICTIRVLETLCFFLTKEELDSWFGLLRKCEEGDCRNYMNRHVARYFEMFPTGGDCLEGTGSSQDQRNEFPTLSNYLRMILPQVVEAAKDDKIESFRDLVPYLPNTSQPEFMNLPVSPAILERIAKSLWKFYLPFKKPASRIERVRTLYSVYMIFRDKINGWYRVRDAKKMLKSLGVYSPAEIGVMLLRKFINRSMMEKFVRSVLSDKPYIWNISTERNPRQPYRPRALIRDTTQLVGLRSCDSAKVFDPSEHIFCGEKSASAVDTRTIHEHSCLLSPLQMVGDDKLVHLVVFSEAAPSFSPLSEKEENRTSSETTPAEVIFREDITIDTHCFLTDLLGAMDQSFVYATGNEKEKTLISLGPEIFIRAEGLDKKRSCWLFSTYLEFLGPWSVEEKIAKCIVQIIQLLRLGQVDCRAYEPFQETPVDPFRESHPEMQIINRSEMRTLTSYRSDKEYLRFVGFSRDLDEIIVSKDLVASLRESYFQDPSSERLKDLVKVCTARGLERKRLVNPQILAEIGLFIIREGSPEHFSVFAEAVQVAVECKKLYRPWLPSDPVIYMAPEEIDSALAHRALGGIVEPDTMRATVEKYGWLVTG